jgi:hypothetical protein
MGWERGKQLGITPWPVVAAVRFRYDNELGGTHILLGTALSLMHLQLNRPTNRPLTLHAVTLTLLAAAQEALPCDTTNLLGDGTGSRSLR